jgi:signal transduction histidine kinase
LLGPDQEINLYRIVQEGLNNVIKHSQASQVILEIKREPASISISLFDNGRGFDPELTGHNGVARPSFGLTGIRERAKVLGGFIILQSAPGTGTRLTLNVPLGKNGK